MKKTRGLIGKGEASGQVSLKTAQGANYAAMSPEEFVAHVIEKARSKKEKRKTQVPNTTDPA